MDYCRTISHEVQQGDTFYRLAQRYHTTVPDIVMRNPGLNAYNLQVGTRLRICPGHEMETQHPEERELNNDMREQWSNHNLWTAMFLTSLFNSLDNRAAVEAQVMEFPDGLAEIFRSFYAQPTVNQLRQLFTEHEQIVGNLAEAIKAGNTERAAQLEAQMTQNADQTARLLANVNPGYNYEELRRMFRMHGNMLKNTMMAEANKEYAESVRLIGENGEHLLRTADVLTEGLLEQFYRN